MTRHPDANGARQNPLAPRRGGDRLGLLAAVFAGCFVLALSWFKLSSLDIGYHVAYGRHLLETGRIVGDEPDPFLYPETAVSFVNANWGSQLVMALAERAGGAAGLFALRLALLAVVFAAMAGVVRRFTASWLAVAAAWMLAALAAYERFSLRPELFSYALMSVQLLILVRGVRTWRGIAALGAIQLAWVNLHSYFLVGLILSGAWFAESGLRWLGPWLTKTPRDPATAERLKLLALVMSAQLVACFVNPWHARGAVFPITTIRFLQSHRIMGGSPADGSASAWSEISEFQSPLGFGEQPICRRTIQAYQVALALCLAGAIALLIRRCPAAVLAIVALFVMSLQMRRNIAQFALVAVPLAVGGLAAALPRSRIGATLRGRLKALVVLAVAAAACRSTLHIADGRFYFDERRFAREFGTGYSERSFSQPAAAWLGAQDALRPNLFVDYFSSSNVLPWLAPRFKLFVDTNTFACEEDSLRQAFDVVTGKIAHQPFFDRFGVNVVMLRANSNGQALIRRLARDDGRWALVYADPQTVIFVRRIMPHVDVILANPLSEETLNAEAWIDEVRGAVYARAAALYLRANVPMFLGWYGPAAKLLRASVDLAGDFHESWINLGLCHGGLANRAGRAKRFDEAAREIRIAIDCFETALELDPGNKIAAENLRRALSTSRRLPP